MTRILGSVSASVWLAVMSSGATVQPRQPPPVPGSWQDLLRKVQESANASQADGDEQQPSRPKSAVESPPQVLFTEDWAAGAVDALKWVTFGSPTSRIVRYFQGHSDVFDNNGDENHESGVVSTSAVDLGTEWVSIEADVYLDYGNAAGCWASAMIGLADPDVFPSSLDRFAGVGLSITFHAEGDACWATPPEHRRRVWFSGGFRRLDGSRERIPAFSVEGTAYANRWSRMRIAIHPDDRVSLYMDDQWLWTSAGGLDPALRWSPRLVLGNRSSGSAGKAYMDNFEVWTHGDSWASFRGEASARLNISADDSMAVAGTDNFRPWDLSVSGDACMSLSATCTARRGQLWCANPGQTEVMCGPATSSDSTVERDVLQAVTMGLAESGVPYVGLAMDSANSIVEITAAVVEGDVEAASHRIVEAVLGGSLAGFASALPGALSSVMGVATAFSEPVVVDGELMVRVRLPFAFIRGEDSSR